MPRLPYAHRPLPSPLSPRRPLTVAARVQRVTSRSLYSPDAPRHRPPYSPDATETSCPLVPRGRRSPLADASPARSARGRPPVPGGFARAGEENGSNAGGDNGSSGEALAGAAERAGRAEGVREHGAEALEAGQAGLAA